MNEVLFAGLRYCKSASAIDTRSNHNRIGKIYKYSSVLIYRRLDIFLMPNHSVVFQEDTIVKAMPFVNQGEIRFQLLVRTAWMKMI